MYLLQASLAELRLEVNAAQQISSHAASQLPQLHKSADHHNWQSAVYGASPVAASPRISANIIDDGPEGTTLMRQLAVMRQVQESVTTHATRIASMEGML